MRRKVAGSRVKEKKSAVAMSGSTCKEEDWVLNVSAIKKRLSSLVMGEKNHVGQLWKKKKVSPEIQRRGRQVMGFLR